MYKKYDVNIVLHYTGESPRVENIQKRGISRTLFNKTMRHALQSDPDIVMINCRYVE